LGVASHFGVLTDFPTVGCAKSKLIGYFKEPSLDAKSYSDLMIEDEKVGYAYRTKKNTNPIFVSPGHKIDRESTLKVLNSLKYPYRIPEPTRQAHLYANELRISLRKN
jgi:deoxyribonuclease V